MFTLSKITPTLPMTDIAATKDFYENKLGLTPVADQVPPDSLLYTVSDNSHLFLYQRPPSHAEHTLASITVDNLETAVDELTAKGVVFEHYNMPNLTTDAKGIATHENMKSAWFKDPNGNILSLLQIV